MCFDFGILNFGSAVVRVENNQYHLAVAGGCEASTSSIADTWYSVPFAVADGQDSSCVVDLEWRPSATANGTEYAVSNLIRVSGILFSNFEEARLFRPALVCLTKGLPYAANGHPTKEKIDLRRASRCVDDPEVDCGTQTEDGQDA